MIRNEYTYRKLRKAFTGTKAECKAIIDENFFMFPKKDVVVCTRGNNRIAYYRPCGGENVNDKIWMMHWNALDNWTLYV